MTDKRVFIVGWDNARQAYVRAAEEIRLRGGKIIYWVVTDIKEAERLKNKFQETFFHWHEDAIRAKPCPEIDYKSFAPVGEEVIKNFFEAESLILCMKKFYKFSPSVLARKNFFHEVINYWYGLMIKLKPDIIFFYNAPHSVYDYAIFMIAKYLKIKTAMFSYAGMGDKFLIIEDYRLGSQDLRQSYELNKRGRYELKDLSPEIRGFYEWHQKFRTGEIQPLTAQILKNWSGLNLLLAKFKIIYKSIISFSLFTDAFNFIKKELGANIKKEYLNFQTPADFSKKYIYLALSYQPEASTSPMGGLFVDQIWIAKILSYCLPDGWLVYIKEHPVQWPQTNLAYNDFRFKGYYEELAKIKNVRLVPVETNSHELINNAQAVSTVTGTCALEAFVRLKPVLLFGNIWYMDCPGVFKIADTNTCLEAIKKIKAGFKIKERELLNFLYSLDKVSFRINYFNDKGAGSLSEEETGRNIIKYVVDKFI